jgi:hypothetical protein
MRHDEIGLKVYIKSLDHNTQYAEFSRPRYPHPPNCKDVERFIDVTAGEQFSIVVDCKETFDFSTAQGVNIVREVDDDVWDSAFHEKQMVERRKIERKNAKYYSFKKLNQGESSFEAESCIFLMHKVTGLFNSIRKNDKFASYTGRIAVTIQLGSQSSLVFTPLEGYLPIRFLFWYRSRGKLKFSFKEVETYTNQIESEASESPILPSQRQR